MDTSNILIIIVTVLILSVSARYTRTLVVGSERNWGADDLSAATASQRDNGKGSNSDALKLLMSSL